MAWIELHQALRNHPKLLHLKALTGVADKDLLRAKLENLWLWCFDYCPLGRLAIGSRPLTAQEIADASEINSILEVSQNGTLDERCHNGGGTPPENQKKRSPNDQATLWLRSLIDSGWIDEIPGGPGGKTLQLHDWKHYGGKLHAQRQADAERQRDRRSGGRPLDVQGIGVRRGERGEEILEEIDREEERPSSGQPPLPLLASPGDPGGVPKAPLSVGDQAEERETVNRYAAWSHPPADKKLEGIRECRALGLSHDYIRNGAQVNKPADVAFWDVMKALKAAGGIRRASRTAILPRTLAEYETPAERARVNGNPSNYVPPVLEEQREVVQQRQDKARDICDELLGSMDQKKLAKWSKEAETAAAKAKIPAGALRESFVKGQLRIRVAKEHGIEGI